MLHPGHHEHRTSVAGHGQDRRVVARQPGRRHGEVDALGRAQRVAAAVERGVEAVDLFGPHPAGVDDHVGAHVGAVGQAHPDHPAGALVVEEPGDRHVVGEDRAVGLGGGSGDGERQAGVVGLRVPVHEAGHQPVGLEVGEVFQRRRGVDAPVALADAQTAGEVVAPQRRRVGLGHAAAHHPVLAEQGDEERKRTDEMRRVLQQALAFGQRLVHQAEIALLKVTQAAVDQLGGPGRRPGREVVRFDQGGAQAPGGGVEGDAATGDPPADHDDVEALVGEGGQRGSAIEAGGCADGPARAAGGGGHGGHATVAPSGLRRSPVERVFP